MIIFASTAPAKNSDNIFLKVMCDCFFTCYCLMRFCHNTFLFQEIINTVFLHLFICGGLKRTTFRNYLGSHLSMGHACIGYRRDKNNIGDLYYFVPRVIPNRDMVYFNTIFAIELCDIT